MLLRAAAERTGGNERDFTARNSLIRHVSGGHTFTYGELAADAAKLPLPSLEELQLKDPTDWRLIGSSIPRLDIPSKVRGDAVFGIDVRLPGMKYAAIAMSPVFGGSLDWCDPDIAMAMDGVRKVIPMEGAVAVVADNWWLANRAVEALPKRWGEAGNDREDGSTILASLKSALRSPLCQNLRDDGDCDHALTSAAKIVEAEYSLPYLEHATLEPMNCTARVTDTAFELWVPTQLPEHALWNAADAAGMPVSVGIVNVTQIGGGFGRRQEVDFIRQAVAIAKTMKGVPIKLLWSREETTQHGFYRPAFLSRVCGGLDAADRPIFWQQRIAGTSDNEILNWLGSNALLYAIPNMNVSFSFGHSHVPEGQMRGVGFMSTAFVSQSFVDELAVAAAVDSYEFQRGLLDPDGTPANVPPAEVTGDGHSGESPRERTMRMRAVLDEAAARASWGQTLPPGRGRGIAIAEMAGTFLALVVEVTLDGKGWFHVDRIVFAGDPGRLANPKNAEAQIQGAIASGLTHAIHGEITIDRGRVVESNFHDYPLLRIDEMPDVEVHWILSGRTWGGLGESAVAVVAPALVNAIFNAGGQRVRTLPLKNHRILPRELAERTAGAER